MKVQNIIFRHYTSDIEKSKFDKELLKYSNHSFNFKPSGLWGSPRDDENGKYYTWEQWLENEDYSVDNKAFGRKYYFDFKISDSAKILIIRNIKNIEKYRNKYWSTWSNLNLSMDKIFESLYKDYDGIFLFHGNNYMNIHLNSEFHTWDVDSIVVWNSDVIIEI